MRVALVLGGGGARGHAHVGVIEVLQERGFQIVSAAGCSIGALVGGLFAAGRFDAYSEWIRTIGRREALRLMDPAPRAPGLFRGDRIMARVGELLGEQRIEDLPIPFTAVATDLLARRPVRFRRGPLALAIRASIALPPAFTPVALGGRLLADGGLTDPLPVDAAAESDAEAIIAVSLNGNCRSPQRIPPVNGSADSRAGRRQRGPRRQHGVVLAPPVAAPAAGTPPAAPQCRVVGEPATGPDGTWTPGELPSGLRRVDVVNLSLETVEAVLTRHRLAACPPDLLVEIPADACGAHEFHRVDELIQLGRAAAVQALDGIGLVAAKPL